MKLGLFVSIGLISLPILGQVSSLSPTPVAAPRVIPLIFDTKLKAKLDLEINEPNWLTLVYRASPDGEILHEEVGEQIWWLQDSPILLMGSTGLPLPPQVINRATVYLQIYASDELITENALLLTPQKSAIQITGGQAVIQDALGKAIAGVDAGYLSQVANYLAGNLTTLDVYGTSYHISSFGEVINSSGDWSGLPQKSVVAFANQGSTGAWFDDTEPGPTIILTLSITVPSAGKIVVNASSYFDPRSSNKDTVKASISRYSTIDTQVYTYATDFGYGTTVLGYVPVSTTNGYTVYSAGTYTYNFVCSRIEGAFFMFRTSMTAIFCPD